MNLGILVCDHIREPLATKHGQYPEMFGQLLNQVDQSLTFTIYNAQQSHVPRDINECDSYLITGSRHGVNDDLPWLTPLEDFIRSLQETQKKLIGICFGHQLIAKALGGKVIKSPKGWGVGMSQNVVTKVKPWMTPTQNQFNLLMSHQDQVIELPNQAEILASNDLCPFYMIQKDNNLTIQGHPEFNKTFAQTVLEEDRKAILDPVLYKKALESLSIQQDDQLVAQWIINFLNITL